MTIAVELTEDQARAFLRASQYLDTTGRGKGRNVTLTCFDDLMLDAVSIPIGEREWRVERVRDQG